MNTVAERLCYLRGYLGLSQVDVATRFGIPYNSYRKYEHGSSEPGADAIAGISRSGINANWLLTGEGPMLLADLKATTKPIPVNVDLLCAAVAAVERFLEERGTVAPADKKAKLATSLYAYAEAKGMADKGMFDQFLKLVA